MRWSLPVLLALSFGGCSDQTEAVDSTALSTLADGAKAPKSAKPTSKPYSGWGVYVTNTGPEPVTFLLVGTGPVRGTFLYSRWIKPGERAGIAFLDADHENDALFAVATLSRTSRVYDHTVESDEVRNGHRYSEFRVASTHRFFHDPKAAADLAKLFDKVNQKSQ
jgi:hypothetical protein